MEAKKFISLLLFAFVFVGLSNLFLEESKQVQGVSFMRELKSILLGMVYGASWPSMEKPSTTQNEQIIAENTPKFTVLRPNLSSCHSSHTYWGKSVNCCPPKKVSQEPIIDFQFPNPSSPLKIRRAAHNIDPEYINKYKKAIAIMKSLPYDDPRSLMRLADVHCVYCTGAYNQENSNLSLLVHGSWLFFPWHRMLTYFHERILGGLIGDENFALPFWNWDNPKGMFIHNMFMNGSLNDPNREKNHVRKVADINYDYSESTLTDEDQMDKNLAFMYNQMISGAKTSELFMGCSYKSGENGFCDGMGTFENAPHNTIHMWVGSSLNPEGEDMAANYASARDPIFFPHHGNVDRLWEVWKQLQGKLEIEDPEYLDTTFYFHNEHSQLVRIKVRDVLNITKLGYAYEKVDNLWVNARPKPSVPPKIARHILKMRENKRHQTSKNQNVSYLPYFGINGKKLESTIRVKVQRPKINRSKREKEEEEEVLVVYGIEINKDKYVKFDVFINAVDVSTIGPESREFAGTFVNLKKGLIKKMREEDVIVKRKKVLKLGISELLEDLEAEDEKNIWVTLLPRSGGGNCTTIEGVSIEYLPR